MRKPYSFSLLVFWILAVCSAVPKTSLAEAEMQEAAAPAKKPIVHPEVLRITAIEVKDLLAKKANIVVVDVNPKDFFDSWHISSAVNIPYNSMGDVAKRKIKLKNLPFGNLIVLYCLCEEGADSSEVALELRRLGHARDKVKVLEGGLIQWDAKGYPMIKQQIP